MMEREIILPENKEHWLNERAKDVTSTEVACLFGLSPYRTIFELWHEKKNEQRLELEGNERMLWGNRLESAIAQGVAEDQKLSIRKMDEYMRIKESKLGASFDFAIEDKGILEVKNVDALRFRDAWDVDESGEISAPHHIELQVQAQLLVSGRSYAKIACLSGGNKLFVLDREIDSKVSERILEEVHNFWYSIDRGICPEPDFQRDSDFISQLYRQSDASKVIDAAQDTELYRMASEYKSWAEQEKQASAMKSALKAEMIMRIGDASKVLGDGFTISAGTTGETVVESFVRKPFRNFRVSFKKEK